MPFRVSLHVGVEPLCATHEVAIGFTPDFVRVVEALRSGVGTFGLKMSPEMRQVVRQYEKDNDLVLQFLEEKLMVKGR